MNNAVISVEHLSKQYDLGVIGTGTSGHDLNRWWQESRDSDYRDFQIGFFCCE